MNFDLWAVPGGVVRMHFAHAYCACITACCTAYRMLVYSCTVRVGMLCVHMSCWHFVRAVSMLCLHDILCLHDGILCMNIGMLCMNIDIVHEH